MRKCCLIIAAPSECSDILYATQFNAPDPYIYFSIDKEKGMIVSTLEYGRAKVEAKKGIKVYNRTEFQKDKKEQVTTNDILMRLCKRFRITTWLVPGDFPLKYADFLREHHIKVEPCSGEFFPKREVKNKTELEHIKKAMQVTENGMYKALDILKDASVNSRNELVWQGDVLTSEKVRSEIEIEVLRGGGTAFGTIVACGEQGAQPHNHGTGPIYANKSIIIDIFPRMHDSGYWGDLTRTVVKGKAPDVVKQAFKAVKDARDQSKKYVKAGVKGKKSYEHALDILNKAGFQTGKKKDIDYGFIHGLGHGVGLDIHEYPRLSPVSDKVLKKGNVVTVEPGVYYPEWGGVRLEDMVIVQEYKCKTITKIDTFLEI